MRPGVGLRNAVVFLVALLGLHYLIVKTGSGAGGGGAGGGGASASASGRSALPAAFPSAEGGRVPRRRPRQTAPGRSHFETWPPTPDDLRRNAPDEAFGPSHQVPYTGEDDERAALHRLVFSQPDPRDVLPDTRRAAAAGVYGALQACPESAAFGLPLTTIDGSARGAADDEASLIYSWAGYEALPV